MRTPLVAGNWKMNKTVAEARDLVSVMSPRLREISNVEKVLCPPFIAIPALAEMLDGSGINVGAQNMHWEEKGAFTGEVSPGMVKEFCQYVILGHSERRTYFGETDESVYVWMRRFESEEERQRLYDSVYQSDYWKNEIAPRIPAMLDREQMKVTRIVATPRSVIQ